MFEIQCKNNWFNVNYDLSYLYYLKKSLKNRILLFDVKEIVYFSTGPKGNIGNTGTYRK